MHRIITYIKEHHLEIAILVVTIIFGYVTAYISIESLGLQRLAQKQELYPFFHYTYSNHLFHVEGNGNVAITQVDWQLPEQFQKRNGPLQPVIINGLPLDLSENELLDFFANQMGLNLLQNSYARDLIECNFYSMLAWGGSIPVLASITYDQNDQHGLKSEDFVLIMRLDTQNPEIVVPDGGRNIKTSQEVVALFNKYSPPVGTAMDEVGKLPKNDPNYRGQLRANGKCLISIGQPIGGY